MAHEDLGAAADLLKGLDASGPPIQELVGAHRLGAAVAEPAVGGGVGIGLLVLEGLRGLFESRFPAPPASRLGCSSRRGASSTAATPSGAGPGHECGGGLAGDHLASGDEPLVQDVDGGYVGRRPGEGLIGVGQARLLGRGHRSRRLGET